MSVSVVRCIVGKPCPSTLQLIDLTFDLLSSVQFVRFTLYCCWCFFCSAPPCSLLRPDLGLPASCCGIPEAPGAPGSFFPSSPTSTGKPPDCSQIPPQILPPAQMRREAPRGFASLSPQASEIPETPEGGRRLSAPLYRNSLPGGSNRRCSHSI